MALLIAMHEQPQSPHSDAGLLAVEPDLVVTKAYKRLVNRETEYIEITSREQQPIQIQSITANGRCQFHCYSGGSCSASNNDIISALTVAMDPWISDAAAASSCLQRMPGQKLQMGDQSEINPEGCGTTIMVVIETDRGTATREWKE